MSEIRSGDYRRVTPVPRSSGSQPELPQRTPSEEKMPKVETPARELPPNTVKVSSFGDTINIEFPNDGQERLIFRLPSETYGPAGMFKMRPIALTEAEAKARGFDWTKGEPIVPVEPNPVE